MRKSRTVVKELESLPALTDVTTTLANLAQEDITVPGWGTVMFVFVHPEKMFFDVSFFEDVKDFFIWYSKVLIKSRGSLRIVVFQRDGDFWRPFLPPTLIGVNLRTRLRF